MSVAAPLLESSEQPKPSTKKRKLEQILIKKGVTSGDGPLSTTDKAEREIEQYLVCPKIDTEDDPLVWWLQYSSSYPINFKVAKKYFSICATREASERLFSVAGNIVNSKRTCLKAREEKSLHSISMLSCCYKALNFIPCRDGEFNYRNDLGASPPGR
uniref:HAT C-terminal dimerisation domain-containing protein n=1 Tax=Amphimedon queenslandica TaxID=400682 RepID=A0A1X7VM67_AMPQE